jgi:hypothetical protein
LTDLTKIASTQEEIEMTPKELKKFAQKYEIDPKGLSKTELVRGIQRKEGNFDCFASALEGSCDQPQCLWRDDCLEESLAA